MLKLKVYNQEGKEIETIELDNRLLNTEVNDALLHQAVVMYRANVRTGRHSTKTRAYVSGGGKKPWRQKGTGRARVGSIRSPLWRHGGVVFGPHPRDYSYSLPRKIRNKALQISVNARLKENAVFILDDINIQIKKTKEFYNLLKNFHLNETCLLVLDETNQLLRKAARNIPFLQIKDANSVNAFDVLKNKRLLMTKKTFSNLSNRIKMANQR